MKCSVFDIQSSIAVNAELKRKREENGVELYDLNFSWDLHDVTDSSEIEFTFDGDMEGCMYKWTPQCKSARSLEFVFADWEMSMLSFWAPVVSVYDGKSVNKYTVALSECKKLVYSRCGPYEHTGNMRFAYRLPIKQFTNKSEVELTVYVDKRAINFSDAVSQVSEWWEKECNMPAANIPSCAKDPMYSFWYSYHQDINEAIVEDECRAAKALGFDACIIDDGWQTEKSGGYGYCGDWEPVAKKFPDMAAHVQRVHDMGVKYLLWYSVPFIGHFSKNYDRFKNMILRGLEDWRNASILDPRYKEVREFLKDIYKKALIEWDLDGFKLDFIDRWHYEPENTPYNPAMDIEELSDAVDLFMIEVFTELRAIKPDIMIEFRQRYIGPAMRQYGNIFRVSDCPYDYMKNRLGVIDMRFQQGNSAVHSDMLMWHKADTPENGAIQIINVMFGTLQYSARLENNTDAMNAMSKFWLSFLKQHKETLQNSKLEVTDPQMSYTSAMAVSDKESITAVYTTDKIITPADRGEVYIANGSYGKSVFARLYGEYKLFVYDCYGEMMYTKAISTAGITEIEVPIGGLARLLK